MTNASDQNAVSHVDLQFSAGSHTVRAAYAGGGGLAASQSGDLAISTTTIRATTTTTIWALDQSPWANEPTSAAARIEPDPGEGIDVEWLLDGVVVATSVTNPAGFVQTLMPIPTGGHTVVARFVGGNGFGASTSDAKAVVAAPDSRVVTTTTASVETGTVARGQELHVTVRVSPALPDPGSVWLERIDGPGVSTPTMDAADVFHFDFVDGQTGTSTFRAVFGGSATRAASISDPFTLTTIEDRAPVTVTLTPSQPTAVGTDPVTLHIAVTPDPGLTIVQLLESGTAGSGIPLGPGGTIDIPYTRAGWLRACSIETTTFQGGCSPILILDDIVYPTTTTLTISPAAVYGDEQVVVDVAVDPLPEVPVGMTFSDTDGRVSVPIDPVTGTGHAVLPADSTFTSGPETVTDHVVAHYPGTPRTAASDSAPADLTMKRDHLVLTLDGYPGHLVKGQPLTLHLHTSVPTPWWPDIAVFTTGPLGTGLGFGLDIPMDASGDGTATFDTSTWPAGDWLFMLDLLGTTRTTPASLRGGFTLEAGPDTSPPVAVAPWSSSQAGGVVDPAGRVPISVHWAASDVGWGLDHVDVEQSVDGAAWEPLATSAGQTTASLNVAPGHRYRFRVRATDLAGNDSGWMVGPESLVQAYPDESHSVSYHGTWRPVASPPYWGGHVTYSRTRNASLSFTFTGRSFAWIGARSTVDGSARVYLDGTLLATVDLHSSTGVRRVVLLERHWSTSARHTVKIVVVGTAGHPRVDIDGFVTGS